MVSVQASGYTIHEETFFFFKISITKANIVRVQPWPLDPSAYCEWQELSKSTEAEVAFVVEHHLKAFHHTYLMIIMY